MKSAASDRGGHDERYLTHFINEHQLPYLGDRVPPALGHGSTLDDQCRVGGPTSTICRYAQTVVKSAPDVLTDAIRILR